MLDLAFILLANYAIFASVLLAGLVFVRLPSGKRKQPIILALILLPLSYALAKILGHFIYDPRPFVLFDFVPLIPHAADNGFPSDHTLFAAALAAAVFPISKKASAMLLALAVSIGFARVYAGVHSPADILAALAIPFAILGALCYFLQKIPKSNSIHS